MADSNFSLVSKFSQSSVTIETDEIPSKPRQDFLVSDRPGAGRAFLIAIIIIKYIFSPKHTMITQLFDDFRTFLHRINLIDAIILVQSKENVRPRFSAK